MIVAQVTIRQFVVGKRQWILNSKLFRIVGNLFAILFAADIQPDDLQTLRCVLPLQFDQARRLCPARLAPGRVKIQDHNFSFVVGELCALIVIKRPAGRPDWPARWL